MSPFQHLISSPLPSSMEHSLLYEKRNTDNTYKDITDYLMKCRALTLADAEYGTDFISEYNGDLRSRTFINKKDRSLFQTIVFGEVMPDSAGTHINAKGNFFVAAPVNVSLLFSFAFNHFSSIPDKMYH